jgi:hypothetical protein
MTDDLSLSEDAFVFGDGALEKEKVTIEKRVYDVLLKRNADLMDENDRLKKALFFSIEYLSVQKASLKQALDNVESDIEKLKRFREDLVKGWKE